MLVKHYMFTVTSLESSSVTSTKPDTDKLMDLFYIHSKGCITVFVYIYMNLIYFCQKYTTPILESALCNKVGPTKVD